MSSSSQRIGIVCLFITISTRLQIVIATTTGDPTIECGTNGIHVNVPVNSPFKGHVFVRGHYKDQMCRKDYRSVNETTGELLMDIGFDHCGMRRKRQTNPRGMSISSTLIVSSHPKLITYGDRAYQIECFYVEEHQVVQSNVKVSPMRAMEVTVELPMPTCQYRVLLNGPTGELVSSLNIGDIIYHSWECKSTAQTDNIYCMLLHSCTADDGDGSMQQIVDHRGCTMDEAVFPEIRYTSDLAAGVLMKAFKFADHPNVFFQCQINLSLAQQHTNGTCQRPVCTSRKRKRSISDEDRIVYVNAPPLLISDLKAADKNFAALPSSSNDECIAKSRAMLAVALICWLYMTVAAFCFLAYLLQKRQHLINDMRFYC